MLVCVVPLGALVAFGGAYSASTLPLLAAAATVFLASGAHVAAERDSRALDLSLVAFVAAVALQLAPFPPGLISRLSPAAWSLQTFLSLETVAAPSQLSIDPRLTREGLATVATAVLLFWAARATFTRGGLRTAARTMAWAGFAAALVGLAQQATEPDLLLWYWKPLDAGARPFGPFVNRNHFATWLLMAISLTAGYLIAHLRSHRLQGGSVRLVVRDLLADGGALLLGGALTAMLLALVASLSRAAMLGLVVALAAGVLLARRRERPDVSLAIAGGCLAAVLGVSVWVNREGLLGRLDASMSGALGRPAIWAETMPVVRDFWATGTGLGTYGQAMLRYQQTREAKQFNQAHNDYLQLAAEGGLLLTIPAAAALWHGFRAARRRLSRDRDGLRWMRIGAAAGLSAIAAQSVFEGGLRMPANALLFALLAAVVVHRPRRRSTAAGGGAS